MSQPTWIFSKFSQNYRQLSAIYFYCFTRFVEQFLADFLLLFLPPPSPLAQKALFTAKISFSTTSHRSVRAKRQDHAAFAFARYAHMLLGGATRLQGLLRFLALAHSCVGTERLFSLERAFRAICTYCERFCDDPALSVRAIAHNTRVRICARCGAPDHVGAAAFALRKCAEPSSFQSSKSAIDHHLLPKKRRHMSF